MIILYHISNFDKIKIFTKKFKFSDKLKNLVEDHKNFLKKYLLPHAS